MKKLLYVGLLLAFAAALCWPGVSSRPQSSDPILIGAGDIGDGLNLNLSGGMATAALIDTYPSALVFADGDLSHNNGTDGDFARAYEPTWGRFKNRTIPAIGNHEYNALNGAGYFNYFGPAAGDATKGYYSLNVGAWHVIVLNSGDMCYPVDCEAGSPQEVWLKNDLAANTRLCTLALFHEPLYTSVAAGQGVAPNTGMQAMWQDLYNANIKPNAANAKVDLVVNGHVHNYERFAPQDANGNLDTANGIVQITAGTGGTSHFTFGTTPSANSLARNATAFGVLKLTLHSSSYDWQFIPIAGQTFTDSGTQACH